MKTIIAYLSSKTVQGILGLVAIGVLKTQHVNVIPDDTLAMLAVLFTGWAGIGARAAIKPIEPK